MMKTTTIKIGLIAMALIWTGATINAQQNGYTVASVNELSYNPQDLSKLPKMEKDIVILENVLGDLFSSNDKFVFSNKNGKGMHIPGNGVIFNLNNPRYGNGLFEGARVVSRSNTKEVEDEVSVEEFNQEQEETIRDKSKEFLANYGSLLSELKSGEKVMLNIDYSERVERESTESQGNSFAIFSPRMQKQRMQSSISYETINQLNNGKISLDQAMNAVESKIIENANEDMNDANILAGILDNLLQSSMDGKFRRRNKTSWTYFDGFGLMFNIQMTTKASPSIVVRGYTGDGPNSAVTIKRDDDKAKEDEELVKAMEEAYPEFEKMLKENIVQYGRTLRSLGEGESIIVNVDFGSLIQNSKLPRSIRMVVPKSNIDAYARGQKSLEQVVKDIDVTQLQSRATLGGFNVFESSNFPTVIESVPQPVVPGVPVIKGRARSKN